MRTCRACPAEVVFVTSAKSGRSMILNAKPEKRVLLMSLHEYDAAGDPVLIDGYVAAPSAPGARGIVVDVYTDHHVTCPNANQFKRSSQSRSAP